jgi:hypothetical protein
MTPKQKEDTKQVVIMAMNTVDDSKAIEDKISALLNRVFNYPNTEVLENNDHWIEYVNLVNRACWLFDTRKTLSACLTYHWALTPKQRAKGKELTEIIAKTSNLVQNIKLSTENIRADYLVLKTILDG